MGTTACYGGLCGPDLGGPVHKSSAWFVPSHRPQHSGGTQCRLVSPKTQTSQDWVLGEAVLSCALDAALNPLDGKRNQPIKPSALMFVSKRVTVDTALTP